MSILDKYGREPITERRTKQVGTKIEPSLFEEFEEHCRKRGLSNSEALRYLVIELLQEDKGKEDTGRKPKVTKNKQSVSKKIKTSSNSIKGKEKKKTKVNDVTPWTINKMLPCSECKTWSLKKNYNRDHARKHGYEDRYDFIQANLEKIENMVLEERERQKSVPETLETAEVPEVTNE